MAPPHRQGGRSLIMAAMVGVALHLVPELSCVDFWDVGSLMVFATPTAASGGSCAMASCQMTGGPGSLTFGRLTVREVDTPPGTAFVARKSAVNPTVGMGPRILNAMGAGAVAAVIQAMIAACMEPIVNRVLVKRMKVMDAVRDVKPSMIASYFKTTITTNMLKFPLFEAVNAVCQTLAIPSSVRGIATGFIFTSTTLPITNFRYRKSMQMPVNWGNIYEAYLPTVMRDMVYGVARNYATSFAVASNPAWTATSPQVLFLVVLTACFCSAPFNELRGYLLQSKGQQMTFGEFFKPANFIRSTFLGAMQQAVALALGYWFSPVVKVFVMQALGRA